MLEAASQAGQRLDDASDAEALHDFRVAIRRTRSALRAWKPKLEKSVRKRDRRALRALQQATGAGRDAQVTGAGRDAQVALEWLAAERASLRPAHRLGHDWLVERLDTRLGEALGHAREGVREAYQQFFDRIVPRLEVVTIETHLRLGARPASFGEALAERARAHAGEVTTLLARIGSVEDAAGGHAARVACKRLRYLVEPVRDHVESARNLVKRCKRLQDLLGDLNDAHVQRDELGTAIEAAAAERARRLHDLARSADDAGLGREARRSERAGLVELTRRAQARMMAIHGQLEADWFEGGIAALVEDVEEFAAQLEAAARRDVEIERKYLLLGPVDFSPVAAYVETIEIRQGYLPGERLRERLRRSEGPAGVHYERTVKLGAGVERIEFEEPTTERIFDTLWPLTEGCRIHKRRHKVRLPQADGPPRVWEIDEFLDQPLWLAEIEFDDPRETPALPEWLAPHVDREVTDDPSFTNLKLAR